MSGYVQRPSPIPESPPNASPPRRASTGFNPPPAAPTGSGNSMHRSQQLQQLQLTLPHHHTAGGGFSAGGAAAAAALGLSLPPRGPGGSVSQSGMIMQFGGSGGGVSGGGGFGGASGSLSPAAGLQAMAGLPPRPLSAHHSAPHLQLLQVGAGLGGCGERGGGQPSCCWVVLLTCKQATSTATS